MISSPEKWSKATLGELTSKLVDGSHNPPPKAETGRPMLSARNIMDGKINYDAYRFIDPDAFEIENRRTDVSAGDVLLTIVGTIGRTAVVPDDYKLFTLQRSVAVFTPAEGIDSKYLSYFFASAETQKWFEENAKGTAQKGVYLKALAKLDVPVAPLPEQRRIVAKVDGLTTRTARARKELDRIPTLIARYKERLLSKIFERLDELPDGQSLRELTSFVTSGSRGWAKFYAEAGDLFVRVGNVQRTNIKLDLASIQHVQPPSGAEGRRTRLETNDLLITITADLGRIGVYTDERAGYINQHVALARLEDPRQAPFIAWYLSSEPGQLQLKRNTRGATKAGLGLDDIRDVIIPQVAEEKQAEIVRRIESAFGWLDRMATDHAAATRLLPKLDAAILAKAFRGELVPQDPNDEPANLLLERIKAERAIAPKKGRGRKASKKPLLVSTEITSVPVAYDNSPRSRGKSTMPKSRHDDDVWQKPYLAKLLKRSKNSDAQSLFKAADLPVADFYKQLAWEIDAKHIIDDSKELKAA